MKKTKKEWIEWFNSLDDNVEIDLQLGFGTCSYEEKLEKVTIYAL